MGFTITVAELMAFLRSKGYTIQTGSGRHGTKAVKGNQKIPIPAHSGDMPLGTVVSILGQAGYNKAEYSLGLCYENGDGMAIKTAAYSAEHCGHPKERGPDFPVT